MSFLARIFTRTRSLERVNQALRAAGLDPYGFPEAVRLTLVRLTKDALGLPQRGEPRGPEEAQLHQALEEAARLFGYCYLGPDDYAQRNEDASQQERRLALAETAPEGREGRIVSLALLTGHAHESLGNRFEAVVDAPVQSAKTQPFQ